MYREMNVNVTSFIGHATGQAVSRWLPTSAALVPPRVRLRLICDGQGDTEAGFVRVLRFIPQITPHSSSILWGWYIMLNNDRRTKWT
jgi:hypothetical protein